MIEDILHWIYDGVLKGFWKSQRLQTNLQQRGSFSLHDFGKSGLVHFDIIRSLFSLYFCFIVPFERTLSTVFCELSGTLNILFLQTHTLLFILPESLKTYIKSIGKAQQRVKMKMVTICTVQ